MIVLTTAQFQTFAGPVNSAPTALPMLLIVLYCLAWTVERMLPRMALVLLFNFLLVNTGYGLFIGGITVALLAIECWKQRVDKRGLFVSLGALAISLLTIIWFISDYNFNHVNTSLRPARLWEYPLFAGLMFGRFVRPEVVKITWLTYTAMLCGIGLLLLGVAALLIHLRQIFSTRFLSERRISLIIVIVLGYGLLFAMNAALGRAGMGLNVSQSSRFVTLMIPGFLGLYFHLLTLGHINLWRFSLPVFLLLLLPGHLPLNLGESHPASYFSRNKRQWKDCYLQTEDFQKCEAMSEFKLLPAYPPEVMKRKLDYLKEHRLNLFANPR
jgi:hypothetical protein